MKKVIVLTSFMILLPMASGDRAQQVQTTCQASNTNYIA
jgi:hypothetical protein